MKQDDYGCVVSSQETVDAISDTLRAGSPVAIAWGDQNKTTQFDILFSWNARGWGNLQGGIKAETYLFVSIMRLGAFAFDVCKRPEQLHHEYIAEKLLIGSSRSAREVAGLIGGVIDNLAEGDIND
jgi:hypothetical protein